MIKVLARGRAEADVLIHEQIGESFWGDGLTSKRFAEDLSRLGDVQLIRVSINSPGGSVSDGVAIYNALRTHGARIEVAVDGLAASIASVIAMAGDTITMRTGALMMIHSPWTLAMGDAEDMRSTADVLDKYEDALLDIYLTRAKLSRDQIKAMLAAETWLDGEEAVEFGFADAADAVEPEAAAARRAEFNIFAERVRSQGRAPGAMRIAASLISKPPQATADLPPSAPADQPSEEDVTMTTKDTSATDAADIRNQAIADESARRAAIRERFGRFSDAHRKLLDACLDDPRCSVETASERLLAKLGEGAEPLRPPHIAPVDGGDARERFRAGAVTALAFRSGIGKREEGNEFNGMTLADLAAHSLSLVGESVKGLSRDAIARKVLAAHTSSDFPNLLSTNAGKVLRAAYESFPNTWNLWALKGSVSDFKIAPRIQLGSFNSLALIPEGGEYSYGSLAEEYENAQAQTKGKAIALTRQMIVNDDLGGFNRRAQLMGRAAARSVNSDAYAYLTSGGSNNGPTSSDGVQFFHATHANYTGTGTAMSVASFGVGRAAMRKQKDKSGVETLNIEPRVLIVPVGKEDLARQLMTSEADPANANSRVNNIYRGAFTVGSDPYLDGISATAWYLFADPADVAAFEVVFLDGNETPFIDEAVDFDTDAMKFKVRLDYGVAKGDWRGGYKNNGA